MTIRGWPGILTTTRSDHANPNMGCSPSGSGLTSDVNSVARNRFNGDAEKCCLRRHTDWLKFLLLVSELLTYGDNVPLRRWFQPLSLDENTPFVQCYTATEQWDGALRVAAAHVYAVRPSVFGSAWACIRTCPTDPSALLQCGPLARPILCI